MPVSERMCARTDFPFKSARAPSGIAGSALPMKPRERHFQCEAIYAFRSLAA
jgi:hypothetical protein